MRWKIDAFFFFFFKREGLSAGQFLIFGRFQSAWSSSSISYPHFLIFPNSGLVVRNNKKGAINPRTSKEGGGGVGFGGLCS